MAWELSDELTAKRDHHDASAMVAELVGTGGTWSEDVELLVAEGSTNDEGGGVIEVRLRPTGEGERPSPVGESCYRYLLRPWGVDEGPRRTGCDGREAIAVAERVPPPVIAADAREVVAAALGDGSSGAAPQVEQVKEAVAGLVDERGYVTVEQVDGATGVGIFVPEPGRDCLLARRTRSGQVEVWSPQPILVAPGESSCDGATAARGGAQGSPH
jgi:hypothetical protein